MYRYLFFVFVVVFSVNASAGCKNQLIEKGIDVETIDLDNDIFLQGFYDCMSNYDLTEGNLPGKGDLDLSVADEIVGDLIREIGLNKDYFGFDVYPEFEDYLLNIVLESIKPKTNREKIQINSVVSVECLKKHIKEDKYIHNDKNIVDGCLWSDRNKFDELKDAFNVNSVHPGEFLYALLALYDGIPPMTSFNIPPSCYSSDYSQRINCLLTNSSHNINYYNNKFSDDSRVAHLKSKNSPDSLVSVIDIPREGFYTIGLDMDVDFIDSDIPFNKDVVWVELNDEISDVDELYELMDGLLTEEEKNKAIVGDIALRHNTLSIKDATDMRNSDVISGVALQSLLINRQPIVAMGDLGVGFVNDALKSCKLDTTLANSELIGDYNYDEYDEMIDRVVGISRLWNISSSLTISGIDGGINISVPRIRRGQTGLKLILDNFFSSDFHDDNGNAESSVVGFGEQKTISTFAKTYQAGTHNLGDTSKLFGLSMVECEPGVGIRIPIYKLSNFYGLYSINNVEYMNFSNYSDSVFFPFKASLLNLLGRDKYIDMFYYMYGIEFGTLDGIDGLDEQAIMEITGMSKAAALDILGEESGYEWEEYVQPLLDGFVTGDISNLDSDYSTHKLIKMGDQYNIGSYRNDGDLPLQELDYSGELAIIKKANNPNNDKHIVNIFMNTGVLTIPGAPDFRYEIDYDSEIPSFTTEWFDTPYGMDGRYMIIEGRHNGGLDDFGKNWKIAVK